MLSLLLICAVAIIGMWIAALIHLQLARRACLIEGLGVFASIWRGIRLFRAQLGGVGLTWLILLGVDLVYPILVVGGIKLVVEDLRHGDPVALFAAFACYGLALIAAPRLQRRPPATPVAAGNSGD